MRLLPIAAALGLAAGGLASAQAPAPKFAFPVACEIGRTCEIQHYVDRDPGAGALDYRCGRRTYDKHDGTDIRVPDLKAQQRGVDVLAAAAGRVVAIRDGVDDVWAGPAAVKGVECGNRVAINHGGGWLSDYCHLAKGSVRVKTGDAVQAGQPIGRVGMSGLAEFPHLHMSIRQRDVVVDPFAPAPVAAGACAAQAPLWTEAAAARMPYRAGAILNAGLAGGAVSLPAIEAGGVAGFTAASPAVLAYVRAIGLAKGDVLAVSLTGPDGRSLAKAQTPPMDRDKAQWAIWAGERRPAAGWPKGEYRGVVQVLRGGKPVLERRLSARL